MAKVIAPFKIIGTLDDINFYVDENNNNLARTKGKTGITSEEFNRNPIFDKIRKHGKEFGRAAKKGQSFRGLALYFNKRAKDGSYSGRGNKLMFEIIEEDTTNLHGERTFEKGIENPETRNYFVGFEGNKLRPLKKVFKTNWAWDENNNTITIKEFNPEAHVDWPEKADNVHLAIALANWNYNNNKFETHYSQEIIVQKEEETQTIVLTTENLCHSREGGTKAKANWRSKQKTDNNIQLLYFFIGFSIQERKKIKELKRANNTVTIIWSK